MSYTGVAGDVFPIKWQVVAGKSVVESGYSVTGTITVTNPNPVAVNVSVADELNDATVGTVDCDAGTANAQATGAVGANGTLTCTYTAAPAGKTATQNTATVTVDSYTAPTGATGTIGGGIGTAAVTWGAGTLIGDNSVTLADARFTFSQLISADRTEYFTETLTCPTSGTAYTNGTHVINVTNTATLTGVLTSLSRSASATAAIAGRGSIAPRIC